MTIHLVNPRDVTFGTSIIPPRWPYVLAGATLPKYGAPSISDETSKPLEIDWVRPGDIVGIGIRTLNSARGYAVGRTARERVAFVTYGGIHATLFPGEAMQHGAATAVVIGDGDHVWRDVLADCARGPTPAKVSRSTILATTSSNYRQC